MFDSKEKQLVKACTTGDQTKVEKLLAAGVNIDAYEEYASYEWSRPIYEAICNGHFELAKFLAEKGADINRVGRRDELPILSAARMGEEYFDLLVAHGADIHAIGSDGHNVLHYAAMYGHLSLVKELVAQGFDPATETDKGQTAERLAQERHQREVAAFLRELTQPKNSISASQTGWHITGDQEISHVEEKPTIGFTVTNIFNFAAGTYTHVITAAHTQSQSLVFFKDMPDQTLVENAKRQMIVLNSGLAEQTPAPAKPKSPPTL